MAKKLDDILNDCLEMLSDGESIGYCLERFPEHCEELRPILEMSHLAMMVTTSPSSNQKAKTLGLSKLVAAVKESAPSSNHPLRWLGWQFKMPRKAYAGVIAVFVAIGSMIGTDAASAHSVPGDPLYWIKTQRENISLILPQSDISKAETHARLATRRVHEMSRLTGLGRFDEAQEMTKRIRIHLGESAGFIGVRTTADRMEMPIRTTRSVYSLETLRIKSSLQRDMKAFRSNFAMLTANMAPARRDRFEVLMYRSNIDYFTLISALEGHPISVARPFWRVETGDSLGE